MKILIGTANPGKIEAARRAFSKYFNDIEIEGIKVSSGVSDEPVNDEIYKGATNRIKELKKYANKNNIDADYYISAESGITDRLGRWMIVSLAAMENKEGIEAWGIGPGYPVPDKYVDEIIKKDLQVLMDRLFNDTNIGQKNGGISKITHNRVTRMDLNESAFIMCLTKYINGEIWQ